MAEKLAVEQVEVPRQSMSEPWKKIDPKKAASLMNRHSKTLRREQAGVRKLLRQKDADPSERVKALHRMCVDALNDQIRVGSALDREYLTINFTNFLKAAVARRRLLATCNEVAQTLQQLRLPSAQYPKSGSTS